VALIVAFVCALVATPIAAVAARRFGIVDSPGPLKVHSDPVPYLGGVAVFAALAGPVAVERPLLLLPIGLAMALGLADDRGGGPSPVSRLILETAIGVIAAVALPVHGLVDSLVTVALVVALLNAINLLDGLDGLASGVSVIAAIGFAFVVEGEFQVLALSLVGSLLGFLVWNRPPARIYLGDAGSYLIGTTLAMLLMASFVEGGSLSASSGAVLFVAVPVVDAAIAIVRRVRARRPLLQGDRGHVYDQLVDRGWEPVSVVALFIGAEGALVCIGLVIGGLAAGIAIGVTALLMLILATFFVVAFTTPGTWKAQ
jgi:UDP-GlcNAc:undecaprenyl-phosphate/decaprenyl-phosphate GlcNAc-1-phosphate transferase